MLLIELKRPQKTSLYGVIGPQFKLVFTGKSTAQAFAAQIGAPPVIVTAQFWEHCMKAATEGGNITPAAVARIAEKIGA